MTQAMQDDNAAAKFLEVARGFGEAARESVEGPARPAAAPPDGQPAPEKPAPPKETPPAPEPTSESGKPSSAAAPEEPTSSGFVWDTTKYKTEAEARRGMHNLIQHAKTQQQRADDAMARLAELEKGQAALLSRVLAGGQPAAPTETASSLKALEDIGIPADVITRAVKETSIETVQSLIGPILATVQADQQMAAQVPDYVQFIEELNLHVAGKADLKQTVDLLTAAGQPLLARQVAWRDFEYERKLANEQDLIGKAAEDNKTRAVTRADAAPLAASRSEGRPPTGASDMPDPRKATHFTKEEVERARDLLGAGHSQRGWGMLLGHLLPDELQ